MKKLSRLTSLMKDPVSWTPCGWDCHLNSSLREINARISRNAIINCKRGNVSLATIKFRSEYSAILGLIRQMDEKKGFESGPFLLWEQILKADCGVACTSFINRSEIVRFRWHLQVEILWQLFWFANRPWRIILF